MDVREKLIEILEEPCGGIYPACELSDYLLDSGVTVHEWISVKDMLPEKSGVYITFGCTAVPVRWLHNFDKEMGKFGAWWDYDPDGKEHPQYRFIEAGNITHWMPLPEPPKGE